MNITATRIEGFKVRITIEAINGYSTYEIYRNDSLIATVTDLTYTDTLPDYGRYKYKYRGIGNINSDYSSEVTLNYITFDTIILRE